MRRNALRLALAIVVLGRGESAGGEVDWETLTVKRLLLSEVIGLDLVVSRYFWPIGGWKFAWCGAGRAAGGVA